MNDKIEVEVEPGEVLDCALGFPGPAEPLPENDAETEVDFTDAEEEL